MLCCPCCKEGLTEEEKRYVCLKGHTFDKAKEGYVNLLTGSRPGEDIGDNREMAKARHAFLESGIYGRLREGIHKTLQSLLPPGGVLCDAGCGEGYYSFGLPENYRVYGFDISKNMLRIAGKRQSGATLFAASVKDIPLSDGCTDGILHVFAPFSDGEFARILKDDGFLLWVGAGKRHLWEMKEVLYDRPYENDEQPPSTVCFSEERRFSLTDRVTVTGQEAIQALFAMTPYRYRTPKEGTARLSTLNTLTTDLDFLVRVYRKRK